MRIKVVEGGIVPTKAYEDDGCYDLCARTRITVQGREEVRVPLGVAMEIPAGYRAIIRPRSSVLRKKRLLGVTGVIDSGYRGELLAQVVGLWEDVETVIEAGERIFQIAFEKVVDFPLEVVQELDETERGKGGFGYSSH